MASSIDLSTVGLAISVELVVIPIYKSGPPDDVSNYRPIALTSISIKIMERVIANEVSGYFLQHGLISKQQRGFLTRRSTVTNLVETLNDWTLDVNTRQCCCCIYGL